MVSEFAMSEIRSYERNGFTFTYEEVIRLNALGLAVDHGEDAAENYALPRVAFLAGLTFREPTIEHEMWLDRVRGTVDFSDAQSLIIIHAFALTREAKKLPPINARFRLKLCVDWFMLSKLRKVTFRQLVSALEYVRYGCDEIACEYPADAAGKSAAKEKRELASVAVGVMRDAIALGVGLSLNDIRTMSVAEVSRITQKAIQANGAIEEEETKNARANALFYRTLEQIIKEKEIKKNG